MWWVHLIILLTFLVYVPQSKHFHLITGPANVYFHRLDKVGRLRPINFEEEEDEDSKPKKKCLRLVLVKFKTLRKLK